LASGYLGGVADLVLMRVADAMLVFPGIILALVLASVLGPTLSSSMVALGIVYSPVLARVVRSGVLSVRHRDFIVLTALYGLSSRHRMWRHVLPNALAPAVVQLTLIAGTSLLAQTGLSFLGIGLQPPLPSWGSSLAESFRYILVNATATMAPGLTVVLTVLSLYRIGDALRDALATPQQ
jgi:peptide/nickel transport system permease protein